MDAKDLAYEDYLAGMKYKDIAEKYNVSINTVKSWQKRNGWTRKADAPPKKCARKKDGRGAPKGNKNAVGNKGGHAPFGNKNAEGHGAPDGNLNAVKHGAYQTIYAAYLPEEEKAIYEQMPGEVDLEAEIKLLRLKLARILNNENLLDEDRDKGILACSAQLERLMRTQAQIKRKAKDEEEQDARIAKLKAEVGRIEADKGTGICSVLFAGEGDLVD